MGKVLVFTMALLTAAAICAAQSIDSLKAEAETARQAAEAAPGDYAANWKAAMAFQKYSNTMEEQSYDNWKNLSKTAAKTGMHYGEIAAKLNPQSVEGWYWYGQSVGVYSDCVSIFSALTEGLQGKTQKAFETAYNLDKSYDSYGPIICIGRYWQVLPGIAGRDTKKAMTFFNEYMAVMGSNPKADKNAFYYRGDLYKEQGMKAEAKADLQRAVELGSKDAAKDLAELQ